jgi:leader peptidase (prepilin peptidase)/N-methyltransferase
MFAMCGGIVGMEIHMRKMIILLYLVALGIFDWKEQKVPVGLLYGGAVVALGLNIYTCVMDFSNWKWVAASALLGVVPGCFMLMAAYVSHKAGYGDGLALINVGLLTNYGTCLALLCFSMLLMTFFSIGMLVLRRVGRNTTLPYLPFLATAYLLGMVWGG